MGIRRTGEVAVRIPGACKHLEVGLGWDPSGKSLREETFDLDVSAFLLNNDGKVDDVRNIVYYNNLSSPDGSVFSEGDDLTGDVSAGGDDEKMHVRLDALPPEVKQIVFAATIHCAAERGQSFRIIPNSFIRLCDADTAEVFVIYNLREDFGPMHSVIFGRLARTSHAKRQYVFNPSAPLLDGGLAELCRAFLSEGVSIDLEKHNL